MAALDPVPISTESEAQLLSYPIERRDLLRAQLLEYGTEKWHWEVERVRYDILYLGNGDGTRAQALIQVAKRDCRDVMAYEYRREDGLRHEWARWHEANRRVTSG